MVLTEPDFYFERVVCLYLREAAKIDQVSNLFIYLQILLVSFRLYCPELPHIIKIF